MRPTRVLLLALLAAAPAAADTAYHGNAQHTGYSPIIGPATPQLKWALDLQGEVISSPVVGQDGVVYLGSVIRDTRHPEHFITAVRPDGVIKWQYPTGWWDTQTQSSPAIGGDGRIYVGAQDHYLYALNPDGTLAWRYQAASPVQQHPVVGPDGTVYIGLDGALHAITPAGQTRWTAPLGTTSLPGGPALSPDGQTIYAFGHDVSGPVATLYAFRTDGTLRWQFSGFYGYYPALSPPTVAADGTVIVVSGDVVAVGPDGVQRWRYSPSASYYNSYNSVAVTPAGEVVFAFSWYLGKLTPTGAMAWQNEFLGGQYQNELESTYSAPLVDAAGRIYLGLGTGKRWTRPWGKVLRAYSGSGQLAWEFPLGEGVYTSSPTIGPDGTLYVGSMDGKLYAIGEPAPPPANGLRSISFNPASIASGGGLDAVVTLLQPAPAGGATVTLASAQQGVVSVPGSAAVPAGATTATFKAAAGFVTQPTTTEVCGMYAGTTKCAPITVTPPPSVTIDRPLKPRVQNR